MSDTYVDPEGDPDAEHELFRPEEQPPGTEEAWDDDEPMEGPAPTG